jgi:hypothetical protein
MSSPGSTGRSSNPNDREGGDDWMPAFAGMTVAASELN